MNRADWDERKRGVERKRREAKVGVTVTWLPEPVMAGRIRVVGVCSDCDPAVARGYGVKP